MARRKDPICILCDTREQERPGGGWGFGWTPEMIEMVSLSSKREIVIVRGVTLWPGDYTTARLDQMPTSPGGWQDFDYARHGRGVCLERKEKDTASSFIPGRDPLQNQSWIRKLYAMSQFQRRAIFVAMSDKELYGELYWRNVDSAALVAAMFKSVSGKLGIEVHRCQPAYCAYEALWWLVGAHEYCWEGKNSSFAAFSHHPQGK